MNFWFIKYLERYSHLFFFIDFSVLCKLKHVIQNPIEKQIFSRIRLWNYFLDLKSGLLLSQNCLLFFIFSKPSYTY